MGDKDKLFLIELKKIVVTIIFLVAWYLIFKYVFFTSFFENQYIGSVTGLKILIFIVLLVLLLIPSIFFIRYIIQGSYSKLKKVKKRKNK